MTRILRVVNSALFGMPRKIDSIERAVVYLGLRGIKILAIAAGVGQLFRTGQTVESCTPRSIWVHSIAVAVTARELAREAVAAIAEDLFVAGLIHDLGLLLALQQFPAQLQTVCQQARLPGAEFCQLEREIIGTDHQWLGEGVTARWRFPRACQIAARFHHTPITAAPQDRTMVTLIHVADTICCKANHGFNLTALNQSLSLDTATLAQAGLDSATIERVSQRLPDMISAAADLIA